MVLHSPGCGRVGRRRHSMWVGDVPDLMVRDISRFWCRGVLVAWPCPVFSGRYSGGRWYRARAAGDAAVTVDSCARSGAAVLSTGAWPADPARVPATSRPVQGGCDVPGGCATAGSMSPWSNAHGSDAVRPHRPGEERRSRGPHDAPVRWRAQAGHDPVTRHVRTRTDRGVRGSRTADGRALLPPSVERRPSEGGPRTRPPLRRATMTFSRPPTGCQRSAPTASSTQLNPSARSSAASSRWIRAGQSRPP